MNKYFVIKSVSAVAFVCYGLSLVLNSFDETGPGFFDLFMGWATLLFGLYFAFAAWCSNILMLLAFIFQKRSKKVALVLSGIAILLSISVFNVNALPVHMGSTASAVKLGTGGYLWFVAMLLLFLRFVLLYRISVRNKK